MITTLRVNSAVVRNFSLFIGLFLTAWSATLPSRAFAEGRKIPNTLEDFPKSLRTAWDASVESGKIQQPSWFPKVSCKQAWITKQSAEVQSKRLYQFDFQKFAREKYLEADPKKFGCDKDSEKATKQCLLTQAYRDYSKSLETGTANDGQNLKSRARKDCYKKWTILVAMDADSDLHPGSLWDVYEMESDYKGSTRAGSTIRKDVVVQHDGITEKTFNELWDEIERKSPERKRPKFKDTGVRRLHVFQSPQDYKQVKKSFFESQFVDERLSPVVEIKEKAYLKTRKERFVDFVDWGMKQYPAEHYMVILWGHGKGWLIKDEKALAHLTGLELADAMGEIFEKTLEAKRPIDNFVADACFMQGVELATELAVYARFISGSAQVQPELGLPYRTFFYEMNSSFSRLNTRLKRQAARLEKNGKKDKAKALLATLAELKKDEPAAIAFQLPHMMSATLKKTGYQGRIEKAVDGGPPKGIDFFTFASVDSKALRYQLIPKLEGVANLLNDFLLEDKTKRFDRAFELQLAVPSIQMYRTDLRTRELGSTLGQLKLMGQIALKVEVFKGSKVAGKLARAANSAEKALQEAIPSFTFAKRYEKHKRFRGMGFWLTDNPNDYEKEKNAFSETLFWQYNSGAAPKGTSAWAASYDTLFEEE